MEMQTAIKTLCSAAEPKSSISHLLAGLHREEDFEGIVEIEDCVLQDETANKILLLVKEHITDLQSKVRSLSRCCIATLDNNVWKSDSFGLCNITV